MDFVNQGDQIAVSLGGEPTTSPSWENFGEASLPFSWKRRVIGFRFAAFSGLSLIGGGVLLWEARATAASGTWVTADCYVLAFLFLCGAAYFAYQATRNLFGRIVISRKGLEFPSLSNTPIAWHEVCEWDHVKGPQRKAIWVVVQQGDQRRTIRITPDWLDESDLKVVDDSLSHHVPERRRRISDAWHANA